MPTKSECVLLIVVLLFTLQCCNHVVAALKLNLTTSCADNQLYFCTLTNISSTYDEPLVLVNASSYQLSVLVLRNSIIGRLPHDIFALAPNLRAYHMHNCGLNRLSDYDFAYARQLHVLVLQRNRLYNLPEKVFAAAYQMEELHLGQNTIHMVHRDAFVGLSQLKYLDMQQNSIHALPDRVFADLINIEHIDLSSNEIEKIDATTFETNTKLRTVLLSDNKFAVFEPNSLVHLSHMHMLDISNSMVDELNVQSVDTLLLQNSALRRCYINGSAVKVHAGNNELTHISIGDKLAVRELDLHSNIIESLDHFVGMLNLQRLDVSKNRIKSLRTSPSPMYLPLPSLTHLNLASNQLQNLSANNFLLLQKLTHLDLSFNHLLILEQDIFESLTNLEKFYIEGNRLHAFDYERFIQMHQHLREFGVTDNDWDMRYVRKMIAYLKEHNIQLPIRFEAINSHDQLYHSTTAAEFAQSKATHHHSSTSTIPITDSERDAQQHTHTSNELVGVHGIHPYWTAHDILALITLIIVAFILLLLLFHLLQEEQCFSTCWRRMTTSVPAGTVGNLRNRPQRLDEETSEV